MQIYFAEIGTKIKVGIARNPAVRLTQLARDSASPVRLIGAIKGDLALEKSIHRSLARFRVKGEFYRDCRDVRATIQNCFNRFDASDGRVQKCSSAFGRACKGIWPHKTAEELAARAGCSVRAAAYELSGEREPSARSIAAVVNEITKRPE